MKIYKKPHDKIVAFEKGDSLSARIFNVEYTDLKIEAIDKRSVTLRMNDGTIDVYDHDDIFLNYSPPSPYPTSLPLLKEDRFDDVLLFKVLAGSYDAYTDGKNLLFRHFPITPKEAIFVPPVVGPPSPILTPAEQAQLAEEIKNPWKPPIEWLRHPGGFLAPNGVTYYPAQMHYYYPRDAQNWRYD